MGNCVAVGQLQHVVEEAILFVPQSHAVVAAMAHGVGDVEEVFPELAGHVFVARLFFRQFQRDGQQIQGVHRHPTGAVGLFDVAAGGQRRAAVEHADVVQTQEAALEDVHALGVLAVHPPGEVQHQLVEDTLQKCAIALSLALLVDLVNAPRGPGMHRRIHVAERPLIGGNLSVGMHVPLAQHQRELLFGELGIDQRERDAVERQVPGRIPRVLPLVRHGDHVRVVEVSPLVIAAFRALRGRGRIARIALQPVLDHVVIELLGPQHAGKALAHDVLRVRRKILRNDRRVELVGFALAESKRLVEAGKGVLAFEVGVGQAQAHDDGLARTNRELVVGCGLGAGMLRIDRIRGAVNDVVVDAVFHVGRAVLRLRTVGGHWFRSR